MALSAFENLRLCETCGGRAYPGRRGSYVGPCEACKGSGFENATAREAFEREHCQSAQPAPQPSLPV